MAKRVKTKIIAVSPSGVAYSCDTHAEALLVEIGSHKATAQQVGHGHHGTFDPFFGMFELLQHKPSQRELRADRKRDAVFEREWAAQVAAREAEREATVWEIRNKYGEYPFDGGRKTRNGCACKQRNPDGGCACGKARNTAPSHWSPAKPKAKSRNPGAASAIHPASEDYQIGLFQGAMERGHLPPPRATSADLRRGYADGAKVARALPTARAEALGVYKASQDQMRAGSALYEAAKGQQNATLQKNPSRRRNPSAMIGGWNRDALEREVFKRFPVGNKSNRAGVRRVMVTGDAAKAITGTSNHRLLVLSELSDGDLMALAVVAGVQGKTPAKPSRRHAAAQDRVDAAFSRRTITAGERAELIGAVVAAPSAKAAAAIVDRHQSARSRNPSKVRNPVNPAGYAAMLAKLPAGVTLRAGKQRVRKLDRGHVVVDGVRLTSNQAAKALHQGA